jgi:hypothetical protein
MLHRVHTGTNPETGVHTYAVFVYCDEHSEVHGREMRAMTSSPLTRPGEGLEEVEEMIGDEGEPDASGGWATTNVLDAMRFDPEFWPECFVCEDKPATMLHTEHAGTNDDGPVTCMAVYCDEHSAERADHVRTRAVVPLTRPGEEVGEEA